MNEYIFSKYRHLMDRLESIPGELDNWNTVENAFIQKSGGWSSLGKNDEERKRAMEFATGSKSDKLRTELNAVRYGAELHAAFMKFLASGPEIPEGWDEDKLDVDGGATIEDKILDEFYDKNIKDHNPQHPDYLMNLGL